MNKSLKSFLTTLAIFVAGLISIISSAAALNYAYAEHNGFVMTCAGITLIMLLGGLGMAFKKLVLDQFYK